jgi:hypothetical protein
MKIGITIGLAASMLGAALLAVVDAQGPASASGAAPGPARHGRTPHGAIPHGQTHGPTLAGGVASVPSAPGQDAFGAIAEIVRLLDADPQTDWSQVNLERLRQHLIDMNEVVVRAEVKSSSVPGGLVMDLTGTGRTESAIRSMVTPHAVELDQMPELVAKAEAIPGGVRLTVTARDTEDPKAVARVRGPGFTGLMTLGAHHQPHHLAMARGQAPRHGHY